MNLKSDNSASSEQDKHQSEQLGGGIMNHPIMGLPIGGFLGHPMLGRPGMVSHPSLTLPIGQPSCQALRKMWSTIHLVVNSKFMLLEWVGILLCLWWQRNCVISMNNYEGNPRFVKWQWLLWILTVAYKVAQSFLGLKRSNFLYVLFIRSLFYKSL